MSGRFEAPHRRPNMHGRALALLESKVALYMATEHASAPAFAGVKSIVAQAREARDAETDGRKFPYSFSASFEQAETAMAAFERDLAEARARTREAELAKTSVADVAAKGAA